MIYLKLFLSFLQIGLFSFGGGYAAMPLIQEQVVTQHGWLTMTEFTDLIYLTDETDCFYFFSFYHTFLAEQRTEFYSSSSSNFLISTL